MSADLEARLAALEARVDRMEPTVQRSELIGGARFEPPKLDPKKIEELMRSMRPGDCAESMKNVVGDCAESMANAPTSKLEERDDHDRVTLADGRPVTADHRQIDPRTGQQKGYVVLSDAERAKGFVRPVRRTYTHRGLTVQDVTGKTRTTGCGTDTTMGLAIAETYAREPGFYVGTFCVTCNKHLPLEEFVWKGTEEVVGS